jgi:hypothetical protein
MQVMTNDRPDDKRYKSEVHRRQHRKNLALLAVLVSFIVLVYFISIARMSGG